MITVTGTNDAPVMTDATITLRAGDTVVLNPTLLGATDVDGPQGNLTFTITDVVNGRFETAADPGTAISSFSYADLAAGRVRFVNSGNGAAPAFRVAASDGILTGAPLIARVVFESGGETAVLAAALVASPNLTPGGDGTRSGGTSDSAPAATSVLATAPAARDERAAQASPGLSGSPDEPQGAFLDRLLSMGPVQAQASLASAEPRGAVIVLEQDSRTAVFEVDKELTWDDFYLRLVSLTVADHGSSGRDAKLDAGAIGDAHSETNEGASLELAVSAAQMTGIALTAGTVWWALRVGGLLTSLMASMPTWRHVDLLPILRDEEDEDVDWGEEDAEAARDEEAVDVVLDASGSGDQR
jgi:hypothetical protein